MAGQWYRQIARQFVPLVVLLLLGVTVVSAQDATPTLTPGTAATGVLTRGGDTTAQVFTFEGTAGDTIRLTATSTDGLALALLVTDAQGQFIGQERDLVASGETRLEATLPTTGLYYVTVLPVVSADSLAEGTYALVLETNAFVGGEVTVETTEAAATVIPPATIVVPTATEAATAAVAEATIIVPTTTPVAGLEATVEIADAPVTVTAGGMQVTLTWNAGVDLDLEVRDPVGGALFFNNPVVDFGGTFGNNVNGSCETVAPNGTEQATWTPGGIPVGSYEVLVYYQQDCGGVGPVTFSINAAVNGQPLETVEGSLLPQQVFITSYEVAADASAQMSGRSGVKGDEQLPASAAVLIAGAQPIERGITTVGEITNEQPWQAYTFTAPAGDIVTITMNAASGSLDPYLALLDPTGNVLYVNDDAAEGVTDSLLANSLLAIDGNYTIVATRYGLDIGGTEGSFNLTISGVTTTVPAGTPVPGTTPVPVVQNLPEEVLALALPEGNIEVTLVWNTVADLQLLVRDPAGEAVYDDSPQIRSGGQLGAAGNVGCTTSDTTPVSYIYWPTTIVPRAGAYEIDVWFQNECEDTTPLGFTLYVTVNNQPLLTESVTTSQPFLPGEHFITSFTIGTDGVVTVGEGGITGLGSLDWESEAATAFPMLPGDVVNGSITPTNTFDLYSFEGLAGDVVTVTMNAAPATNLDTKLYLIGPNGALVAENDDAVVGENTDSLISNFSLPEGGQYIIIATHYGDQYGVTTGAYTLSLEQ